MGMRSPQSWRTALWHLRKGGFRQLREWDQRRRGISREPSVEPGFQPLAMPDYVPLEREKPYGDLRVAVIMDDFSLRVWEHEFSTIEVTPQRWQEEVKQGIDLLFVESAWSGNHGAWTYQLTGSKAPSEALRALVRHCREVGVPTVFWNKEDPPHFEDFLDTAGLFDVVFTSDSNKVEEYRARLGHDRIAPLSFAAQPAIHNPVRLKGPRQEGDLAFAGMYFAHKYQERRAQMDLLLGAAERVSDRMKHGLTIYSRFAGGDERYQFPAPFDRRVVGSLEYDKMLSAYRAFKVFLNVNSVVDSPSMCARRVFEITASGTPVVSAPSVAIPNFFPHDEVPVVHDEQESEWVLRALVNSTQLRDRMVHRAQRRIWGEHTYTHRAAEVLGAAGIPRPTDPLRRRRVTALVSTNRPGMVEHAIGQVARQRGVDVQLALLTHGFDADERRLRALARDLGLADVAFRQGPSNWLLGDCLNALVAMAEGDFIAKIDDDDIYGPDYLLDQTNALWFSGADLVGKQESYLYLGSQNAMVRRNPGHEHRWTDFVAGPTLVGRRSTFLAQPFERVGRGEDTAFLRSITDAGGRIYSADRFNFIQVRGATEHTWHVGDESLLANGVVESYGLNEAHVLT